MSQILCGGFIDPHIKEIRATVTNALKGLFSEKLFGEMSEQEIADRAGLSLETFHEGFRDKYSALSEMATSDLRAAIWKEVERSSPFDRDHLQTFALVVIKYLHGIYSKRSYRSEYGPYFDESVRNTISSLLMLWLCEAHTPETIDPDTLLVRTYVYTWAIFGAAMEWPHESIELTIEGYADAVVATFICKM